MINSGLGTVQLRNMITPKAILQEQSMTTSCPTTMCGGFTVMYGFATESVRAVTQITNIIPTATYFKILLLVLLNKHFH